MEECYVVVCKSLLIFHVDVLVYDYEGYGYSDGCYSEVSMCRDLEEVFKYALGIYPSDHIFLYGESSIFGISL